MNMGCSCGFHIRGTFLLVTHPCPVNSIQVWHLPPQALLYFLADQIVGGSCPEGGWLLSNLRVQDGNPQRAELYFTLGAQGCFAAEKGVLSLPATLRLKLPSAELQGSEIQVDGKKFVWVEGSFECGVAGCKSTRASLQHRFFPEKCLLPDSSLRWQKEPPGQSRCWRWLWPMCHLGFERFLGMPP